MSKIKLKDITPANIRNFLEGTTNSLSSRVMPEHQKEQVIYRAALCNDCLELGRCHTCGCSTPGLFYAPKKRDAKGKWGPMLNRAQWEAFKGTQEYKETMKEHKQGVTTTDGTNTADANILTRSDGGRIIIRKVNKEVPENKADSNSDSVVGDDSKETL